MSTESSAVVRFIDDAQKQHQTIQESGADLPDFDDDLTPARRSYKLPLLVGGMLLFAGGAALAGVYVGKHHFGGARSARQTTATPAATPATPTSSKVVGGAGTTPPASVSPLAPTAPVHPAIAPEVLAQTGFDIRVKPSATISVDGQLLGRAPLRVRNIAPGPHVIEVEAPPGFFSRRVDIELDPGEPQNVNLALDPIEPATEIEAGSELEPAKSRRDRRRARAKARSGSRRGTRQTMNADVVDALELPAAPDKGTLLIGSKPPCDIYIDGEATGLKTPQRAIELSAGTHKVTLVNSDLGIKKAFTVEISPGESTRSIHDLTGKLD